MKKIIKNIEFKNIEMNQINYKIKEKKVNQNYKQNLQINKKIT